MKFLVSGAVGPLALGLVHARSGDAAEAERSAFRDGQVRVETGDPEVTLAGTLSTPDEGGPHPAVLFLTGSGGHTRDQVISGTPMFDVLGDRQVDG
jgi:hypothetical protein